MGSQSPAGLERTLFLATPCSRQRRGPCNIAAANRETASAAADRETSGQQAGLFQQSRQKLLAARTQTDRPGWEVRARVGKRRASHESERLWELC